MGNCLSDPSSKPKGKGQVLGSGPKPSTTNNDSQTTNTGSINRKQNYQGSSPATLGGSAGEQGSERERALAAAEERAKAVSRSVFFSFSSSLCLVLLRLLRLLLRHPLLFASYLSEKCWKDQE